MESRHAKTWVSAMMPKHPYSDVITSNIVEEMTGKALKVVSPQTARIEVEVPRLFENPFQTNLKFCEKIVTELRGHSIVSFDNPVQV